MSTACRNISLWSVEVEGVVLAVQHAGKNINMDLALSDGAITATTMDEPGADYDSLVDAK
jgi:hypothetical protein